MWGWLSENLSLAPRSVYLHNNKLADAGLPDNMFNGSSNVEILILSSNFLRHVPKHLPPALYKLHLKVGGRGQGGALPEQGRAQAHVGTVVRLRGLGHELGGTGSTAEKQRPRHPAISPTLSTLGLGPLPWLPQTPLHISSQGCVLAP